MPANLIQGNYPLLKIAAKACTEHADMTRALTHQITRMCEMLRQFGWRGCGADAFYCEMDEMIFPAMQRLSAALDTASSQIIKIHDVLKEHEERAARLFEGTATGIVANMQGSPADEPMLISDKIEDGDPRLKPAQEDAGDEAEAIRRELSARYGIEIPPLPLALLQKLKALSEADTEGRMGELLPNMLKLINYYGMDTSPEAWLGYLDAIWRLNDPHLEEGLEQAVQKAERQLNVYRNLLREAGFSEDQINDPNLSLADAQLLVATIPTEQLNAILERMGIEHDLSEISWLITDQMNRNAALALLGTPSTDAEWTQYYEYLYQLQRADFDIAWLGNNGSAMILEEINRQRAELFLKLGYAGLLFNPDTGEPLLFAPEQVTDPVTGETTAYMPTNLLEMQRIWLHLLDSQRARAEALYAELQRDQAIIGLLEAFGTLNSIAFMAVVTAISPKAALAFLAIEVGQHLNRGDVGGAVLAMGLFFIFPQGDELADLRLTTRQLSTIATHGQRRLLVVAGQLDPALVLRAQSAIKGLVAKGINSTVLEGLFARGIDFDVIMRVGTLSDNAMMQRFDEIIRIMWRGDKAIERVSEFIRSLDDATLQALLRSDNTLIRQVTQNIDNLGDEAVSSLISTVPVDDVSDAFYGLSRNTAGDHIAYEFRVSGKPDPNLAIYVNGKEFDWYRIVDGRTQLIDAKNWDDNFSIS
ncbi:MAG: hypothetical protein OHK0023_03330 [Anaerolineae bacterium]